VPLQQLRCRQLPVQHLQLQEGSTTNSSAKAASAAEL
jgi:hypothetical protein